MKGGSDAAFDGDIISYISKESRFEDNFIYHDKNRYQDKPLDRLHYNILNKKLIKTEEDQQRSTATNSSLKFSVV